MKPQFDGVRAFAIYMESGNKGLKEYVARLNAEHFDEDGNPKRKESKITRKDPEQMTTEQLVNEMQARGLGENEDKKVKERKVKLSPNGMPIPAPKGTPKSQIMDGYLTEIVESTQSVPKKYSDEEMIRQIKEDMDADDAAKPAPKERVTEKLKLKDIKSDDEDAFSEKALYFYLQDKSNSREENNTAIMRGDSLQGRFTVNADGSARTIKQAKSKLEDELKENFPGFYSGLSTAKTNAMVEMVLQLGFRTDRAESEDAVDASRMQMAAPQIIEEAKNDKELNAILGMFTSRGKPLDYRVFETYFKKFQAKKNVRRSISWNNYVTRNYRLGLTREDIDEAIETLEDKIPDYFIAVMNPFKRMLKAAKETKKTGGGSYRISRLSASQIIGRVDTKSLKKRQEIYDYWKGISALFEDFKKAHNEFTDALDKIDDDVQEEYKKGISDFKSVDVDELNYVKQHDRVPFLEIDNIEEKSIVMLKEFLVSINKYPKEEIVFVEDVEGRDDVSRYGELAQEMASADEEEELQDSLLSFSERRVDPLYAYALEQGQEMGLGSGAIIKDQIKEIKRRMKTGLVLIEMGNLVSRVDKYLEDLKEMESGDLEGFYLPVLEDIQGFDDDNKTNKAVANYLKLFSDFIEFGDDFDKRSKGASTGLGQRAKKDPEGRTMREARSPRTAIGRAGSGKEFLSEFKKLGISDKFNNLLESIVAFFIEPSRSKYKPTNEELPFIKEVGSRPIENIAREPAAGDSPFIHLLRMESVDWMLDSSELKEISNFMKKLTGLNVGSKQKELVAETDDLADTIDDLYDGEMTEMINIEFGNFLNGVFEDAKLDDVRFGLGKKKLTKEWAEEYEASKLYPFEAIFSHLIMKRDAYADPDTGVKGAKEIIGEIIQAEQDLKITKSKEQQLILQAHDEIRKMLGKPIYYGLGRVDNYDSVSEAIDLMNDKYNVDMTAMDVENVVKELDSMNNIGVKYGIPQEGVYFLKANFR